MKTSLITVCHQSKEHVQRYVSSFLQFHSREADKVAYEFVFVENSGQPGLREAVQPLKAAGYEILVVDSKNDGFGAACNLGAKHSTGDVFVFVNPDVRFMTSLDPLAVFAAPRSWGTAKQLTGTGQLYSIDLFPERKNLFYELAKGHWIINKYRRPFLKHCYVVGSFLVIEKTLFERSGGFNEDFFLYYEEAELCRRLQGINGPPLIETGVSVSHEGFGSHETPDHALKFGAEGFITYCEVTAQQPLIDTLLRQLRIVGFFSKTAEKRREILKRMTSDKRPLGEVTSFAAGTRLQK